MVEPATGVQDKDSPSLVAWDYWLNDWPSKPVALTRANAADGYPRPLTPLSQDLVLTFEEAGVRQFYFDTMGVLGAGQCEQPFLQAYYGLVYLNAEQMGELGAVLPGSSRRGMFESILSLEPDAAYQPPKEPRRAQLAVAIKAVRVAPRMLGLVRGCGQRIARQTDDVLARRPPDPDQVDEASAAAWLGRLEEISIECWETLAIGAAVAIALFEGTTKAITKAIGEDATDLTNRLHVGLGGNESAEAGRALSRLAELARRDPALTSAIETGTPLDELLATWPDFAAGFNGVVACYGHRAPAELELSQPSWRANPVQLVDIVRQELSGHAPAKPGGADRIRQEAEAELHRRAKPLARPVIARLLTWSRRLLPQRENAKLPIVRVFDDTRRLLTGVAPRLVARGAVPDAGAVHYLRYQELKEILGGGAGPGADEVQRRRQAHLRCLQLSLPELVEAGPGWIRPLDDRFIHDLGLLVPAKIAASVRQLDGIGASPGVLTAPARVMLDPYEDFEPGEVVIARSVDPGWAPILACAGAVVLDSGGLLCHGAVVARELGIPCVVGVRAATTLAQTGAPITVDGSAGTVQW